MAIDFHSSHIQVLGGAAKYSSGLERVKFCFVVAVVNVDNVI